MRINSKTKLYLSDAIFLKQVGWLGEIDRHWTQIAGPVIKPIDTLALPCP